jgi:peptide/nickel transport system ATP-binding protein
MTPPDPADDTLLRLDGLEKSFPVGGGAFAADRGTVKAVDGVSFAIRPGQTLGLVGESGCGKSTVARLILRIQDATAGAVWFRDRERGWVDLNDLSQRQIRPMRKNIQMIFQDPNASLNPRMPVSRIVGETLRSNGLASAREINGLVAHAMAQVGLRPEYMNRYPHAFSGGQRQRIGLARAIISSPQLVVADEAVSALDVSVQAQILNLFRDLQDQMGLSYLFISHDLGVVRHVSDNVAVMYLGRIVEMAAKSDLFNHPLHPYTEALLSAIPRPDPETARRKSIARGEVGDATRRPTGCAFHPRCRYASDRCKVEVPQLVELEAGHSVACHHAADLSLEGTAARSRSIRPSLETTGS